MICYSTWDFPWHWLICFEKSNSITSNVSLSTWNIIHNKAAMILVQYCYKIKGNFLYFSQYKLWILRLITSNSPHCQTKKGRQGPSSISGRWPQAPNVAFTTEWSKPSILLKQHRLFQRSWKLFVPLAINSQIQPHMINSTNKCFPKLQKMWPFFNPQFMLSI